MTDTLTNPAASTGGRLFAQAKDGTAGSGGRNRVRRHRLRRGNQRHRRGLLQHRDDGLSGDPHRSVLCRADRRLYLSAYRHRRHQYRRHRIALAGCARRWWCARTREHPSNYRALAALDRWLKNNNIPGIAGIDTRALTSAHPREGHAARHRGTCARRQVRRRRARRKRRAAFRVWKGSISRRKSVAASATTWREMPWAWNEGYGELARAEHGARSCSTTA